MSYKVSYFSQFLQFVPGIFGLQSPSRAWFSHFKYIENHKCYATLKLYMVFLQDIRNLMELDSCHQHFLKPVYPFVRAFRFLDNLFEYVKIFV